MVAREEIVEERGARAADVQVTCGTWREARANLRHAGKLTGGKNGVNGALKIRADYASIVRSTGRKVRGDQNNGSKFRDEGGRNRYGAVSLYSKYRRGGSQGREKPRPGAHALSTG